jgi:D123
MNIVKIKQKHVLQNPHLYNSASHPPNALLTTLPSIGIQVTPERSSIRYSFWHPFILDTQHIDRKNIRIVDLTSTYARLLIGASESGILRGRKPESYKIDLPDRGFFDQLFRTPSRTPQGYFLRFDTTSAKDGVAAHRPLKTPLDVIERLVTSRRALNAIKDCFDESQPIRLYFIPFDPTFDTRNEYRCFSAPTSPICPAPRLTAISQYHCTERSHHPTTPHFMTSLLRKVQTLHYHILEHAQIFCPKVANSLRDQGFVFDVRCLPDATEVQLIDLNEFGVAGRCGSALFHWITDAEVLYGGRREVEMRVVDAKSKRESLCFWR